jgi:hypothetical protein
MKKVTTLLFCLLAALAVDFLREGLSSRVYAQLQKNATVGTGETPAPATRGGYPVPAPSTTLKSPYPVSGSPARASGPYPSPVTRPVEKKAAEGR